MRVELLVDTNAQRELRSVSSAFIRAGKQADKLVRKFRTLKMPKLSLPTGMVSAFSTMSTSITHWATVLAGSFVTINSNLEQLQIMMSTTTGSLEGGASAMEDILNFSTKVPFSVDSLADSFVKLRTAGLDPMAGTMQILTDAVAAFGGGSEQFKLVTIAIQQMVGKGVVSMEELRRQLGEQIPTAMRAMAKGLGLSMFDMVDKIKTGTLEATGALEKMFGVLEEWHGGAAQSRMESFQGAVTLLRTEWTKFMKSVGDSKGAFKSLTGLVMSAAKALANFRTSMAGQEIIDKMATSLKKIFDQFSTDPYLLNRWVENISSSIALVMDQFALLIKGVSAAAMFMDRFFAKSYSKTELKLAGVDYDKIDSSNLYKVRGQLKEIGQLRKESASILENTSFFGIGQAEDKAKFNELKQSIAEIVKEVNIKLNVEVDDTQLDTTIQKIRLLNKKKIINPAEGIVTSLREVAAEYQQTVDAIAIKYDELSDKMKVTNDKIFSDQLSLNQRIRNIDREGMSDIVSWEDQLQQIEQYKTSASEAFSTGNIEEYNRYLQEASDVINSLPTSGIKSTVSDKDVANAKKLYEYERSRVRPGDYGSALDPYKNAKKNYENLLAAQRAGGKELITVEEQRAIKRQLTLEVGNKLIAQVKAEAAAQEASKQKLEQQQADAKVKLAEVIEKYTQFIAVQKSVGETWKVVGDSMGNTTEMMVEDIAKVTGALREAKTAMDRLSGLSVDSNYTKLAGADRRANGGPVNAGTPYVIGEYGKELFVPDTNGTVVPHSDLKRKNNTIDINLSLNESEQVQLQGTQQSVDQLERLFSERRRYAG